MSGEEKTVTIRGVSKELYSKALALSKEAGKTVGEVVNEALRLLLSSATVATSVFSRAIEVGKDVLEEVVVPRRVVGGVGELNVRKVDLEGVEAPIVFKGFKKLVFENDVGYELFNSKVERIVLCDEVFIPKSYPKLKVAEKCRFVGKLLEKA